MMKLLKWLLIVKLRIQYRVNLFLTVFLALFGFDLKEHQRTKRLAKAIFMAEKLHVQNNGARYFVLEVDYNPGHYVVRNRHEILAMQKAGMFSSRATSLDFFRESLYYTKAETLSITKGRQIKEEVNNQRTLIIYLIVTLVMLTAILIYLIK